MDPLAREGKEKDLLQERWDPSRAGAGREKLLLGEGKAWMEAGGPPAPAAGSSHASPAPSAGKNNTEPPTFAPLGSISSCGFPSPDSLHGLISFATSAMGGKSRAFPRHRRENNPFSWVTGWGTALPWASLYFCFQHIIEVTKEQIKHCACCVFAIGSTGWEPDFTAHLWSSRNAPQIPRGCVAELGYCWGWGETAASAPVSASAQESRGQLWKVFGGNRSTSALWFAAQLFARLSFWPYPHFFCAYEVFKRAWRGKLWSFQTTEVRWEAFAMYEAEWHCKLDSLFSVQRNTGWFKKAPLWKAAGFF